MAYSARPHYGPPDHEQKSHHFMGRPPHYSPQYPPSAAPMINSHAQDVALFDPESESSDVSDNPGEDYHTKIQSAIPAPLPPPASKRTLESPDAIETRLRDIQRVEEYNYQKQKVLRAKRERKDERIRRKREAQDFRIRAIMDARTRRDERVNRRRTAEDAAFSRLDQETEEEEMNLRRLLKRLKRGLPVDDIINHEQKESAIPTSTPPSTYNSAPPPKRHQPGPPGITNSPQTGHVPSSQPTLSTQPPPPSGILPASRPPTHQFMSAAQAPSNGPFGPTPSYAHPQSPVGSSGSPYATYARSIVAPPDANSFGRNGHQVSPQMQRPLGGQPHTPASLSVVPPAQPPPPTSTVLDTMPPRLAASTYDTRPPPAASSGFASINTPQSSGFATINPRTTGTPPVAPSSLVHSSTSGQNHSQGSVHSPFPPHHELDHANPHSRPYASEGTPMAASLSSGGFGKRTPSTTHPYQMSEAFANRHHHCERTDRLSRGIWTYFGPGGSSENSTGQKQEMYLRCNHDGCRRIDWRTVHGLQCHIVKSHEQPKGTINSLEKALDKYGVPVAEVEAYERIHGEGTAGTMADSKQGKIFKRARDAIEAQEAIRFANPNQTQDLGYRATVALGVEGNANVTGLNTTPSNRVSLAASDSMESDVEIKPPLSATTTPQSSSRFAAVNGAWGATLPTKQSETKDVEMTDAPSALSDSASGEKNVMNHAEIPQPAVDVQDSVSKPTIATGSTNQQSPDAKAATETSSHTVPSDTAPAPGQTVVGEPLKNETQVFDKDPRDSVDPSSTAHQDQAKLNEDQAKVEGSQNEDADMSGIVTDTSLTQSPAKEKKLTSTIELAKSDLPGDAASEDKELEKDDKEASKPNADEGKSTTIRSPVSNTRRTSIAHTRRGSSRRASLAANKAEREKEKERERERERELEQIQQQREEPASMPGSEADADAGENQPQTQPVPVNDEEDEEDGDTVTVNPQSRDRERDRRERKKIEEEELKITPKRQSNGRFLRKSTR